MTIKTGKSAGPYTRGIGTVTLSDSMVKIVYDPDGESRTVYIIHPDDLRGHDIPPVPLFTRDPDGAFVRAGTGKRSVSGRAMILTLNAGDGDLTVLWTALISCIRREKKGCLVARSSTWMR